MTRDVNEYDDIDEYINVKDGLPKEDGNYETIMHCGSISIHYKKILRKFRKGEFMRSDWDYVEYWKENK